MEKHEFVMKVTAYGKTVTIAQVEDAVDIHEFLDMCRALAIGIGYHEGSWEDGVIILANEYLEEEDEADKGERLLIETLQGKHKLGHTAEDAQYVRKEQKVYTGKSELTTNWGPLNSTDC